MGSKSELLKKLGIKRLTTGEYQANLSGLNMFFGAVLGIALTGTEILNTWQYGVILTGLAGIVISILYISSSKNRMAYSIYAIVITLIFPEAIDLVLGGNNLVPDKIRPTLLVWTLMTILVEFWAREQEPQA